MGLLIAMDVTASGLVLSGLVIAYMRRREWDRHG